MGALDAIKGAGVAAISVTLLILYIVAILIVGAVYKAGTLLLESLRERAGGALPLLLLLVLVPLNYGAVFAFVELCRRVSVQPRLAMIVVPLLLVLEFHVSRIRAAAEGRKGPEYAGLAGSAAGLLLGLFCLMRDAPIK